MSAVLKIRSLKNNSIEVYFDEGDTKDAVCCEVDPEGNVWKFEGYCPVEREYVDKYGAFRNSTYWQERVKTFVEEYDWNEHRAEMKWKHNFFDKE
jgi:hypothetical protein